MKDVNWEVLGRSHRVFLLETPKTRWEKVKAWFKTEQPKYDLLILKKGSHLDFPVQLPMGIPPAELKTPLERHHWRRINGLSYVTQNAEHAWENIVQRGSDLATGRKLPGVNY